MSRGKLRIYLGAAPGVGKTFAMLEEAARRRDRGTDVVIGLVETHGRVHTAELLDGLEVMPRRVVEHRGAWLEDLDLDAVLARSPQVVLVDELAHTNAPGGRHEKRWQDIETLLEAGIDVITTVNIQHLESLNDVVEQITGIAQREVVPDAVVRAADQVQLVDQTPEALRRRLAHGNVYPPDRVDAALDNYFRLGNLAALRELALMWVADRVDEGLQRYRTEHSIHDPWETRERIVVAVTGAPGNQDVIRRAARIATRARAELIGVHVRDADGLAATDSDVLVENRRVLAAVGGQYREIGAVDVAEALVRFATSQNATQIILGASARSRWQEFVRGSIINDVVRHSGDLDVHVITPEVRPEPSDGSDSAGTLRFPGSEWLQRAVSTSPFSQRRLVWGWVLALVGPPALTFFLTQVRPQVDLTADLLAFTLLVTVTAIVGGAMRATVSSLLSFLLSNWYLTPPLHTWVISNQEDLIALVVFMAESIGIGLFVSTAARRSVEAARVRGDAETLAALAGVASMGGDSLEPLVEQIRRLVGARSVAVVTRGDESWLPVAVSSAEGASPVLTPGPDADIDVQLGEDLRLIGVGSFDELVDQRVFDAFCHHVALAWEARQLRESADRADRLADANELRAGLLNALSHDVRTPLAAITAAASTLREPTVAADPALRAEFSDTILDQSERLHRLLTNLLELSRINTNAVQLHRRPVALSEVVAAALATVDRRGRRVDLQLPNWLPEVVADQALLERVLANLIDNACKWSPPDEPVRVDAAATDRHWVTVRVVDSGPGIPRDRRKFVTEPFQRLDDKSAVEGTGLGLAVVVGFLEQLGGQLEIDDTPGGGTTMVVRLPAVHHPSGGRPQ